MEIRLGETSHGFRVTRVRECQELHGRLVEMVHEKTGAQLAWLDNGEDNKLFSAIFKTIPEDSTGVFHILEHTVLCGSDKYPVKEPFVELLKSSMNTFLNAMTYPDKTMYPVSSRNRQDYLNLVSVYLDAVFAPRLLEDPNIFRQEGWHMEKDEDGLSYKGVVLNEMKGAMSDVDDVIEEAMGSLLFPDTCYGFNSGGEPGVIQDLTYEKYVETYHRFYHPSNARFYLDGAVPLDETLAMIESYLSCYGKGQTAPEIPMQAPKPADRTVYYAIGESDDPQGRTQYALGGLLATWEDRATNLAFEAIADYLTGSNEAPLTKAVLSSGLAQDIGLRVMDGAAQSWFYLQARGTDESKLPELRRVIKETLADIANKGIDRPQLRAVISRLSYHLREYREPQGLIRASLAASSWLYGGDPMLYLTCDELIGQLRDMVEDGRMDALLREKLVLAPLSELRALPSASCAKEMQEAEQKRLHAIWDGLNEEGRKALEAQQADLLRWQKSEDTPEALATIPVLSVSEIGGRPPLPDTQVCQLDKATCITHAIPSHGIVHTTLYFDLSEYSLEDMTRICALHYLFGSLPTSRLGIQDIQRELYTCTGTFSTDIVVYAKTGDTKNCRPMLQVQFSALAENVPQAQKLIMELLLDTHFDETDRIREIADQVAEQARLSLGSSGHAIGRSVTMAGFSSLGALEESLSGATHYRFVQDWSKDFETQNAAVTQLASKLLKETFNQAHLTVSVTSDSDYLESMDLSPILQALPKGDTAKTSASYTTSVPSRLAIPVPARISYAVIGSKFASYHGALRVIAKIISLEYLWNVVRVQGGAYGSGMGVGMNGGMFCYSFRDPTPLNTLEVYRGIPEFLRSFCAQKPSCDKYILSAVADTEPLISPSSQGKLGDVRYFSQITPELLDRERAEMLSCTPDMILGWLGSIEEVLESARVCVTGNPDAISAAEGFEKFDA